MAVLSLRRRDGLMCGICGIIYGDQQHRVEKESIQAMCDAIKHRGPNDEGYFLENNVGLGMRRLSIIDLSGGKQPMFNEDKSIVTIFNGEIYNYHDIRRFLEKKNHRFTTNSDTEVLVHLYEEYRDQMVSYLNGMFAFAIYDRRSNRLFIARDRMGVKPLYYFHQNGALFFCSEIKSLLNLSFFTPEIDTQALHHYLTFRFAPSPLTLFKGVKKLGPGYSIDYSPDHDELKMEKYWDIDFNRPASTLSQKEAREEIRQLITESVNIRLMSEVPLGVMLSGGIDSAAVTAAMSACSENRISTFTIDYEEQGPHRENAFAQIVANRFSTDHHEIIVRSDEFLEQLERMVYFLDEPIADPAAIPIFDLCRFSKKSVTVLLSGVGGDELFGGYPTYTEALYRAWLCRIPPFFWSAILSPLYSRLPLPGKNFVRRLAYPIESVFLGSSVIYGGFSEREKFQMYTKDFADFQRSAADSHSVIRQVAANTTAGVSDLKKMMYIDTKLWLADSHLIMMDKMSMAHSIELREPLLDYRLAQLAFSLADNRLKTVHQSKRVLKSGFANCLPASIIKRPKRGFSTPLDRWFRDKSKQLQDLLLHGNAPIHGYINKQSISQLFDRHNRGAGDYSAHIFTLLTLHKWLETFKVKKR
ncbi:MAG: asparagine synthase (glutamine-hydrolyzing) [Chitinivibrionales bacterium]|nr:asparagine synthase (glutamine-hydrolyzing) [Chitinivibrionales bacterium]